MTETKKKKKGGNSPAYLGISLAMRKKKIGGSFNSHPAKKKGKGPPLDYVSSRKGKKSAPNSAGKKRKGHTLFTVDALMQKSSNHKSERGKRGKRGNKGASAPLASDRGRKIKSTSNPAAVGGEKGEKGLVPAESSEDSGQSSFLSHGQAERKRQKKKRVGEVRDHRSRGPEVRRGKRIRETTASRAL